MIMENLSGKTTPELGPYAAKDSADIAGFHPT